MTIFRQNFKRLITKSCWPTEPNRMLQKQVFDSTRLDFIQLDSIPLDTTPFNSTRQNSFKLDSTPLQLTSLNSTRRHSSWHNFKLDRRHSNRHNSFKLGSTPLRSTPFLYTRHDATPLDSTTLNPSPLMHCNKRIYRTIRLVCPQSVGLIIQ